MNVKSLALGATIAMACIGAFAQTVSSPQTPRVDKREARQEQRIEKGVASGELNARETQRLEKEQAAIGRAEDKAKADGTVTAKERHHLNKMQNRASRDIHHQKHDRQKAASGPAA